MALHAPHVSANENFRNARPRLPRLPALLARMFLDVRYRRLAGRLAQEGQMKRARSVAIFVLAAIAMASLGAAPARAGGLTISPEAKQALDILYNGDSGAAIAAARKIQLAQPDHPLGFLLEGE